ncbi:MAG: hypothetical protein ACE5KA_06435 [Nitrososphaerales archaeon]
MVRITEATQRKLPRRFGFDWGGGYVIEEVSIKCNISAHTWEPAIQLLEYDDGEQQLRFCVYTGKRFKRMPLLIGTEEITALRKQIKKSRRIKNLLTKLTK